MKLTFLVLSCSGVSLLPRGCTTSLVILRCRNCFSSSRESTCHTPQTHWTQYWPRPVRPAFLAAHPWPPALQPPSISLLSSESSMQSFTHSSHELQVLLLQLQPRDVDTMSSRVSWLLPPEILARFLNLEGAKLKNENSAISSKKNYIDWV